MQHANAPASTILSAPAASPTGGYVIKPAGSGEVKTYTLIYDLYLSSANAGNWHGLFQNDLSNTSDGDLFIHRNGDTFGIGIGGDYPGGAKMDEWHRIAFVITETSPGTVEIARYIDGAQVGGLLTKSADRYAFNSADGFYILTDENNEMMPSGLSAFAFVPSALSATEIGQLGQAKAAGILGNDQNGLEFNFAGGDFSASKGTGTMAPRDAAQTGTIGEPDAVGYPKIVNKEVTILFEEDFEGLNPKLKPYQSASESGGDGTDWTDEAPEGWTRSGTVRDGGPVEFKGWTFHDKASWVATAEDQKRGEFTKASGVVAIVDPDEYDDLNSAAAGNSFNAQMATPDIDLSTLDGRDLYIEFDSSWRQEDQQTARVLVSYDGQAPVEVMLWTSEPGDNFKADATDEHVVLKLAPPAGVSSAKIIFDMPKADNDWWWAVDNIKMRAGGDDGNGGTPDPNPNPTPTPVEDGRIRLFTEDFEGLTPKLKPYESPSESGGDGTDWTNEAPEGWTRSDGTKDGGPVEFKGWTFHDKSAWTITAGDQERSKFTKGSGVVAVADPDEYDDLNSASSGDSFNAKLATPDIDISAAGNQHLYLEFDSSWRPEDNQEARVWVSYDGAAPQPVLIWTSQPGETYKPDAPNEHVALQLAPPAGAQTAKIIFDMPKADNDWWWAIDNIELRAGGTPPIDADKAADFKQGDARYGFEVDAKVDADLTSFTLVYDLRVDEAQSQDFGSLLQLGAANDDDGELFLKKVADGTYGLGINGEYAGEVKAGDWARIAVTVQDQGNGTSVLKKFINGTLVGTQEVSTARFTVSKDGFKLMADENGETFNGKLASFALVDQALSDADVIAKGGTSLNGAFDTPPADAKLIQFNLTDGSGVSDGVAQADDGEGTLRDRTFNPLKVDTEVLHRLLKVGEHIEIDVTEVFKGAEGLTYSIETSDAAPMAAQIVDGKLIIDAKGLGFADFTLTATDEFGNTVSDDFRMRVAGDNAYSFVVLPDTQDYTNAGKIAIYNGMTQFLADQKDAMKLQMVTHVGDVTGSNQVPQWNLVSEAYKALEKAGLRYTLLPGNHDQAGGGSASDHTSNQDVYFDMNRYFADSQDTAHGVYDGEANSTKNNFKTFTAPDGTKWIVLSVEFGPRDDVLRWGNEVLSEYSDHRAIVLTHHYTNMADVAGPNSGPLYGEGTGKNYGMRTSDEGVNDGRDIWDKMVSKHGNVSFVFSGHVFGDGAETQVRYGEQGNPVMQMFVNYQDGVSPISQNGGNPAIAGNGGNGAMRIVIVDPDNDQVHTETYYRNLDDFMTGSRGDADPSREGKGTLQSGGDVEIQKVDFGSTDALGTPRIDGDDGSAGAIKLPQFNPQNGLQVDPGFAPENNGTLYEKYTLVYDMFIPDDIGLTSILQTDQSNQSDGDLWIQTKDGAGAIGANNQDDGPFDLNAWSRVVVVFEKVPGDAIRYRADKYVNGKLIGSQFFDGDRRVIKKDGFILFGDDGNETPDGWTLSAFAMVQKALSAAEVAALGGVDADGPFSGPLAGVNGVQFSFKNGDFAADFGTGTITQAIGGGNTDLDLTGRYREHQETFDNIDLGSVDAQFTAKAGADVKVDLEQTQQITLDGSASLDKLGQIAKVEWVNENGEVVGTGTTAQIDVAGGAHSYTMVATDTQGRISTDAMVVVGVDKDTLLFDNFNDGNLDGWTASGGSWQAAGAVNSGAGTADAYLRSLPGSNNAQILWGDAAAKTWSTYTVRAQIENEGEAPMGLVAYASGDDTQYRLEFAVAAHAIRLVKLKDGVRSVLAEVKDGAPFDQTFVAELSVDDGQLTAAINGKTLFGGAVTDADPLTGGTAGVFHQGNSPLMRIDDFSVRKGALIADAGANRRVLDVDGDGQVQVDLSTAESSDQGGANWYEGDTQLASGDTATVTLDDGTHLIRLNQSVDGQTDDDTALIEVIAKRDILVNDDFSNGAGNWKMIDEGELGQAADWSVVDGALLQSENRYSRQLMGSGDTAPNDFWRLSWSPMGDGYHALRKGAYALYDDAASKNWTDYSLEFDFNAPSGGAVGAMFHYQDAKNYYKLELDKNGGMSQLLSMTDGIEKIEWQAKPHYDTTGTNTLRIDIDGGKITAWLDGHQLFNSVEIHKVERGGVGLYNWGAAGTSYDNVKVVSLVDQKDVTGTAGTDVLRGDAQSELFKLNGGNDLVTTGAGADTIIFNTATNGQRERVTVQDFDVDADRLDLMGADVARHITRGDDTLLMLEGDGDIIRLIGVDSFDDITFV